MRHQFSRSAARLIGLVFLGSTIVVGTAGAEPIDCTAAARSGAWSYAYGDDPNYFNTVELDQKALKYELLAATGFNGTSVYEGRVQLRLMGKGQELLIKLPAILYRDKDCCFENLTDWKGFTLALAVDGKEISREPFRHDANTVKSYDPADQVVAALKAGGSAVFTLRDEASGQEVVRMTVPLEGFGAAVDAVQNGCAEMKAKLAAGDTCRPVGDAWDDW